jgi:bacteriocin biosynthesis cyclodehydratase domain-containing protein
MGRQHLRLRPHVSVVVHGPDDVELRYGVWNPVSFQLRDESGQGMLARLVTGLDGSRSPAELARAEKVPRQAVEELLDQLVDLDVVTDRPTSAIDAHLMLAAPWPAGPAADGRPLVLLSDGELGEQLARLLRDALPDTEPARPTADQLAVLADPDTSWLSDGLATEQRLDVFAGWAGAVVVAASTLVDPARSTVVSRAAQRHGATCLYATVDGPFLIVGPSVVPAQSACYECLEQRILMNLRAEASYQRYKTALAAAAVRPAAGPYAPAAVALLAAHTALEAVNLMVTGSTFTVGRIIALHLPTMEIAMPDVLRLPGCPGCGSQPQRDGEVLYFEPLLRETEPVTP